jgi:hypothetical protein
LDECIDKIDGADTFAGDVHNVDAPKRTRRGCPENAERPLLVSIEAELEGTDDSQQHAHGFHEPTVGFRSRHPFEAPEMEYRP